MSATPPPLPPIPQDRPINDLLFEAVQIHARRTTGRGARRVTVVYEDGSSATFNLNPALYPFAASPAAPAPSWPPADGWGFRPGEFALNGDCHRLGGKDLELLRALVGSPDGLTLQQLRRAVWGTYPVEDSTIRAAISRLKARLLVLLSLPEDFELIAVTDGNYRMQPL